MRRLLLLGLGCVCLFAGSAQAATTRTVTIGRDSYSPAYLRINPGDAVIWRNADREVHTATSLPGSPGFFGTGALRPGQQYTQVFQRPGRYGYLDAVAPTGARGVIQVGPDQTGPRVTRLSVRATPTRLVTRAALSEDVRFSFTVRQGSKRILHVTPRRVRQGTFVYTFNLGGTLALKRGRYRVSIETRDVAGNRGRTVSRSFRVK